MGVRLQLPKTSTAIDLDALGVSENDRAWLEQNAGENGRVTVASLDRLSLSPTLTDAERRIVIGLQRTVRGELRALKGTAFQKGESKDLAAVDALTLRAGKTVSGEAPLVEQVRTRMHDVLWGHEPLAADFARMTKDFISPARHTAPVMSIVGDVGHGKDQAIDAFTKAMCGEQAKIVRVDLSTLTDQDFAKVFGDDAPLALAQMKAMAQQKNGVVLLENADGLLQRAPKIAAALAKRLLARTGEAEHAHVPILFHFDKAPSQDPRQLVVAAIGAPGNRLISATAVFRHLDAQTMARYAKAVLPELLKAQGLDDLVLEIDDDALLALGEALATPHAPLDELEHRLHRFLLAHCDVQTSVQRKGGALRAMIAPELANDPAKRAALVADLHQPIPDLFAGERLLQVQEVAQRPNAAEARKQLLGAGEAMSTAISTALVPIIVEGGQTDDPETDAAVTALSEAAKKLRGSCERAAQQIVRNERLKLFSLLRDRDYEQLSNDIAETERSLTGAEELVVGWLVMKSAVDPQMEASLNTVKAAFADFRRTLTQTEQLAKALAGKGS